MTDLNGHTNTFNGHGAYMPDLKELGNSNTLVLDIQKKIGPFIYD